MIERHTQTCRTPSTTSWKLQTRFLVIASQCQIHWQIILNSIVHGMKPIKPVVNLQLMSIYSTVKHKKWCNFWGAFRSVFLGCQTGNCSNQLLRLRLGRSYSRRRRLAASRFFSAVVCVQGALFQCYSWCMSSCFWKCHSCNAFSRLLVWVQCAVELLQDFMMPYLFDLVCPYQSFF